MHSDQPVSLEGLQDKRGQMTLARLGFGPYCQFWRRVKTLSDLIDQAGWKAAMPFIIEMVTTEEEAERIAEIIHNAVADLIPTTNWDGSPVSADKIELPEFMEVPGLPNTHGWRVHIMASNMAELVVSNNSGRPREFNAALSAALKTI